MEEAQEPPAAGPEPRREAERKWIVIALTLGADCTLGRNLARCQKEGASEDAVAEIVADTLGDKSEGTLSRRVSSINQFLRWCRGSGIRGRPFTEATLYQYVRDRSCQRSRAPTGPIIHRGGQVPGRSHWG